MAGGKRFPYGPKTASVLGASLAFAAAAAFFVHIGSSGSPMRLWPLPIYVSGWPVYGIAAVSFSLPVMGVASLVRARQLGPRELVVDDAFLEAPASPWKAERVRLTRDRIRDVERTEISGTKVVTLVHDGGKLALSNRTVGAAGLAAVEEWLRNAS